MCSLPTGRRPLTSSLSRIKFGGARELVFGGLDGGVPAALTAHQRARFSVSRRLVRTSEGEEVEAKWQTESGGGVGGGGARGDLDGADEDLERDRN